MFYVMYLSALWQRFFSTNSESLFFRGSEHLRSCCRIASGKKWKKTEEISRPLFWSQEPVESPKTAKLAHQIMWSLEGERFSGPVEASLHGPRLQHCTQLFLFK